ncbi:MAG TPA: 50S ribosomal protein L25 [Paracoccaceae bacterium]|nr:50S ribosomal protein L25 [Paracoccaceae bacterium]
MVQQVMLQAATRTTTGKGAARALRREGKVPAVIYGHGREPEALVIDAAVVTRALTHASAATVIEVTVDDRAPIRALLREVQRNPIRAHDILHLDLYEVHADEKITVEVPVRLVGTPEGVRNSGGVLDQVLRDLEIEVFPGDIPDTIDIDVSGLGIGQSIHVRDIKLDKAEILNDEDLPIATVVAPRTEEAEPAVTEEPASGEPELIRKPKDEDEDEDEEAKG